MFRALWLGANFVGCGSYGFDSVLMTLAPLLRTLVDLVLRTLGPILRTLRPMLRTLRKC